MKAIIKFRGLVNISGFHVDPGWKGRLIFSVYNAGPNHVTLQRGEKAFLIWYSTLDRKSSHIRNDGKEIMNITIPSKYRNNLTGQVYSTQILNKRLNEFEKRMFRYGWYLIGGIAGSFIAGILVGIAMDWTYDYFAFHKGYSQERQIEKINNTKEQTKHVND